MRQAPIRLLTALGAATTALLGHSSEVCATPDVPFDDPTYEQLRRLQERGLTPPWSLSGFGPLTEARVQSLLVEAGHPANLLLLLPNAKGFWARPATRVSGRFDLADSTKRRYSVPTRPRSIEGAVELACEYQEGRPCGDGMTALTELDSSAGYGTWLSAFSRLQTSVASEATEGLRFDRLYASLELGPAEFTLGRNIVSVGPGRHTQLVWGSQSAPLNQVSLSVGAIDIPGAPVTLGGAYVVGRLDAPQRFTGTLVTISRAYLAIANRLSLGLSNLLVLGGEGAPSVTSWAFIEEHVHRTGPYPSTGISNRRVGADLALLLPPAYGTLYAEIVFEDSRKEIASALAYDVDYLFGWAASSLGPGGRFGVLLEFTRTGVRSQEHSPFTSGMTNGGRATGPALGPDAFSVYLSPRWELPNVPLALAPWTEFVRLDSDTYDFPDFESITRRARGIAEVRLRAGLQLLSPLTERLWFDAGGYGERVHNEGFRLVDRTNWGLFVSMTARGLGVPIAP